MLTNGAYLKKLYGDTNALGFKAIDSDFTMEIKGFENIYLLTKQFPFPVLSPAGEIEVPTVGGASVWQPQQVKQNLQNPITLQETVAGTITDLMLKLITKGGTFDAKIYHGNPEKYLRIANIDRCFMQLESPDTDFENRSQVLTITGTLFYHFFGEYEVGNVATLYGDN